MKPRIVQLEPYGDYRDNVKVSDYVYKVDFENIIYNLSLEDCQYILSVLHKNITTYSGRDISGDGIKQYNEFASYNIYERNSDRHIDVSLKDSDGKLNWITFSMAYDIQSKYLSIGTGKGHTSDSLDADASAIIMIYEYFLGKNKSKPLEDDEPYFGWCDVEGCEREASNGGSCWRETGYWNVCYKHSAEFRTGKPCPQMKQTSVDREKRRGADGILNSPDSQEADKLFQNTKARYDELLKKLSE